jgi:hypothetical protein
MAAAQPNDVFDDGNQHMRSGSRDTARLQRAATTSDEQVRGQVVLQYPEEPTGVAKVHDRFPAIP